MDQKDELAIFEAGISEPEEMQKLQSIIVPNIGIFTNIGQAHDENFINSDQKTGEKLKSILKRLKHLSITMITKKFMELLYVRGYLKILLLFVGEKIILVI